MELVKLFHVTMALFSILGFIIRGVWMMNQSDFLQQKWVKVLPHIIDTFLLVSALILAIRLAVNPLEQYWLLSKIFALLAYIGLGMIALRFGKTLLQRKLAWIFAILVFIYIILVAVTKQSLPFSN